VEAIDWGARPTRVVTPKGTILAKRVVVTVSTGVLAAGHIRFDPPLPDRKVQAIEALRVGNHNRIGILLEGDPFGADAPPSVLAVTGGGEPISIRLRPFGHPYVVGTTGGRFATYLERAGQRASMDYLTERLKAAFGGGIVRHLGRGIVTAWGGDPWTLGAYSALRPGRGRQREILAEPLDDCLYFAGEAASTEFFSTCHGARLQGEATIAAIAKATANA
jgi:monoamine oxidase